jgi:hypothetical protein
MNTSQILEELANTTRNFAIVAILLALLTAIFMQALYEIGLRASLQRRWVKNWVARRLLKPEWAEYEKESSLLMEIRQLLKRLGIEMVDPHARQKAGALLKDLEGKGRESTIYSLNYQQLCGQIAARIQSEIDQPRSPELLAVFALGMDPDELDKLNPMKSSMDDGEIKKPRSKKVPGEVRDRASFYAETGVDNLQIYLGRLWRKNNYMLNLLVSIGLTTFLSLLATQFVLTFTEQTWVLLSVGGAGGLFAPIAGNLLERVFYPR